MTGPKPLLIPGNMCDARMWSGEDDVILRVLAQQFGYAPKHADTTGDDSILGMAERALGSADGLLLPVGFSMGAIVAMEIATIAPERIAGLVLADYNAQADLPERAAARPEHQERVRQGQLENLISDALLPNYLASKNRSDAALSELIMHMGLQLGPDVFVAQSEALRTRADRVAQLSRLEIPVLYLVGREDRLCPVDWHDRWSSLTRQGELGIIEGAGHMAPLEQPGEFARCISSWASAHQAQIQG